MKGRGAGGGFPCSEETETAAKTAVTRGAAVGGGSSMCCRPDALRDRVDPSRSEGATGRTRRGSRRGHFLATAASGLFLLGAAAPLSPSPQLPPAAGAFRASPDPARGRIPLLPAALRPPPALSSVPRRAQSRFGRGGGGGLAAQRQAAGARQGTREPDLGAPEADRLVELGRRRFAGSFPHDLDGWQLRAGGAVASGRNVIVCAPTGSGKTVVGEMGLLHAVRDLGQRAVYTTPLKALSNQKYADLLPAFGAPRVGLSTGDVSIRKGTARVTVMTTEVYRNLAWRTAAAAGGPSPPPRRRGGGGEDGAGALDGTGLVVFDEFHYMGNPGRGGVWEESVITSPPHVQMVALSATLPNAHDLRDWMESVTGRDTVLVRAGQRRPVPLRYLYATREGLFPLFRDPDAGPGSPRGMLGWRDDDEEDGDGSSVETDPSSSSSSSKRDRAKKARKAGAKPSGSGFGGENSAGAVPASEASRPGGGAMPRGLQVNPALRAAAERRAQRVDRSLERQRAQARYGGRPGSRSYGDDGDDELAWFRNRRGGAGRPAGPGAGLSPREERKERERLLRNELRRSVPSLPALVGRLDQKGLLPAIFFIFSRAGCDAAARALARTLRGPRDPARPDPDEERELRGPPGEGGPGRTTRQRGARRGDTQQLVRDASGRAYRPSSSHVSEEVLLSLYGAAEDPLQYDDEMDVLSPLASENWEFYAAAGLLQHNQVREVAARAARFNRDNPEIAFDDEVVEQFLLGAGSHHAGMLPAHKSFVEVLFRNELMRVVFATETLAAGINMPARTTVICALAKRGDGSSMSLLETSNLLQMAGRAGRRGMDTDGTCVIVATPFETHDDAAKILTDPIKPISSQFTPSYSLCVNLIARGEGKLDVARQLVGKSFAMWERSRVERGLLSLKDGAETEMLQISAEQQFLQSLVEALQVQIDRRSALFDVAKLQKLLTVFDDRELLKKTSKSFLGASRVLELERTTLECLQSELEAIRDACTDEDLEILGDLVSEDEREVMGQIEVQRRRAEQTEKDVLCHPLAAIARAANEVMSLGSAEGASLARALARARGEADDSSSALTLTPDELSAYAKSSVVLQRRARKLSLGSGLDAASLLEAGEPRDDSWADLLAITRTLVSYGCLAIDRPYADDLDLEELEYSLLPAGTNVAMLGFENSLWCVVAIGGAWDVVSASSRLDSYDRMLPEDGDIDDDDDDNEVLGSGERNLPRGADPGVPKAQQEAETLVSLLRGLSSSELAGYVSCLVSEGSSRADAGRPAVDAYQRLTPGQQRAVRASLAAMERLAEVQRRFSVDEGTRACSLDVTNCEAVTAWAGGCGWPEALRISGLPPGDLARALGRALDALRQLGNLPFRPARRRGDFSEGPGGAASRAGAAAPPGIHPDVRRLCREAAKAINRYPVKDTLAFEGADVDEEEEDDDFDREFRKEEEEQEEASGGAEAAPDSNSP